MNELPDSRQVAKKVGFEESMWISGHKATKTTTMKGFQNFVKIFRDSVEGQQQPFEKGFIMVLVKD